MKMQKIVLLIGLMTLFLGCGPSQKIYENNDALDNMITERKIEFEATSASPLVTNAMSQIGQSGLIAPGSNINRIDLGGAGDFLKIAGDSVSANLAYYGERQLGGGYNRNSGIVFKGVPEDAIEIVKDETKKAYNIKFQIREEMEVYNVTMRISPSLSGSINIISSHRTRIAYSGTVAALQEKK